MNYFEEIDAWLSAILLPTEDEEGDEEQWLMRVKKEIKAKILESYRNGHKVLREQAAVRDDSPRESRARKFWRRRRKDGRQ